MRIGICSWWFNRGQAVVARQLRSALEQLGHETAVLARPARPNAPKPSLVDRTGVWDQPGVTEASAFEIPFSEYEGFVDSNDLEVLFFDQNYQLDEIARLRERGVKTIGRFVWEAFSLQHVEPARRALDVIYSLTGCERERYAQLGIESPRVHWGIHPELLQDDADGRVRRDPAGSEVIFLFPGGYMTKRKPLDALLAAFGDVKSADARLLVKAQVDRKAKRLRRAAKHDPRIQLITDDLSTAEYRRLFGAADVCLAPSRWEGLGLHLYEATALGLPIVTNDNPPMNEIVLDGDNGVLVEGVELPEAAPSGIPAFDPDPAELAGAIDRLVDESERARLADGARRARERFRWETTVADIDSLLEAVAGS